jgi:drug/metabolite transporter (DMT)-like permease
MGEAVAPIKSRLRQVVSGRRPLLVLLGSSCAWGIAWMPLKGLAASGFSGIALVMIASLAAALLFLPRLFAERSQSRGQGRWLLGIALLGGYSHLAFTTATMYGDIVRVMVLFYLLPAWGVLGGRLFLGERLDGVRVAAVVLALAGAWLVLGGGSAWHGRIHWTDVVAITCGMAFAANNLLFRACQGIPVASKTAFMLLGAAGLSVPFFLFLGEPRWPSVSFAAWAGLLGYAVVWLCLANLATQFGVTHMEAGRASIIILVELVVAVVTAVFVGGEQVSPTELAGGLCILVAAVIEGRRAA